MLFGFRRVRPARYRGRCAEHMAWRSMIDEVMFEIRELTGQTYVNSYAGAAAETEPTVAGRVSSVAEPIPDITPRADSGERHLTLVAGN